MIHKLGIEWHDLKEDPYDLPNDDSWVILSVKDRYGIHIELLAKFELEKGGFVVPEVMEFGIEFYDWHTPDKVLAWAIPPLPYVSKDEMIQ